MHSTGMHGCTCSNQTSVHVHLYYLDCLQNVSNMHMYSVLRCLTYGVKKNQKFFYSDVVFT